MDQRLGLESSHPPDGLFDLDRRDLALFDQAMRNHCGLVTLEEIEDPVMDACEGRSQFVDTVSQVDYKEEDDTVPIVEWLGTLPRKANAKCLAYLARLESDGHELRRPIGREFSFAARQL
jgi:hypothetical protein